MKKKLAVWVSQRHAIPYRFRKSFIKRVCPQILQNYPFEIDFYGIKYSGNTKNVADRIFFMFGGCEKYILSFMKNYSVAAKGDKFVFFDVGAHVGNHSLFMSKYASEIHSFEPSPMAREALNSKIYSNSITNITVHPVGLADRNDKIPFYLSSNDNFSAGSFIKNNSKGDVRELEIKIGDEVAQKHGVEKIDLIKIDVEGLERQVIDGLSEVIGKSRPCIVLEISRATRDSFGSRDDFESIFPKDYSFYKFSGVAREKSSYKLAQFDYDAEKSHLNIIAIPKEKRIFLGNKIKK